MGALALAALAHGCATPSGGEAPVLRDREPALSTPTAPDDATSSSAQVATSLVDGIPAAWPDLEALALAIYQGPWTAGSMDQDIVGCVQPARVAYGDGDPPQGRYCIPRSALLDGAPWAAAPTAAQAWVFTMLSGDQPMVATVAGTRDALLEKVQCGLLDRVWQHMPVADQSCTADGACELPLSACWPSDSAIASCSNLSASRSLWPPGRLRPTARSSNDSAERVCIRPAGCARPSPRLPAATTAAAPSPPTIDGNRHRRLTATATVEQIPASLPRPRPRDRTIGSILGRRVASQARAVAAQPG